MTSFNFSRSLAVSFALLLGAPAFATSYGFEYVFGSGTSVTGTFTGDASGNVISNIANVSLSVNGTVVPGSIFAARNDGTGWLGGPIVSFDVSLNNFLFADSDIAGGDAGYTHLFFVIQDTVLLGAYVETPYVLDVDSPEAPGRWILSDLSAPTPVPDSGNSATFFCGALALIAALHRRRSR